METPATVLACERRCYGVSRRRPTPRVGNSDDGATLAGLRQGLAFLVLGVVAEYRGACVMKTPPTLPRRGGVQS